MAQGRAVNPFSLSLIHICHVKRTARRPLPSGDVTEKEARTLFIVLVLLSFPLVLTLNTMTILLSVAALALAWVSPFMKRYTHLPQVVLGAAFGLSLIHISAGMLACVPGMSLADVNFVPQNTSAAPAIPCLLYTSCSPVHIQPSFDAPSSRR